MIKVNAEAILAFLETQGAKWISKVRLQYRPAGRGLTPAELRAFAPFFEASLLDGVRIARVPNISNPDFYSFFLEQSLAIPLDFTQMSAITFVDTVLVSARHPVPSAEELPLLFHELVHVVQYFELGLEDFVKRYVRGWATNGLRYSKIPMEVWAYDLETRFRSGALAFSVAAEVREQLA